MTVVSPLTTRTWVLARCELMCGLPWIAREKSGDPFSTRMRMITVLAEVICGWTFRISAASFQVTVTVLLATV